MSIWSRSLPSLSVLVGAVLLVDPRSALAGEKRVKLESLPAPVRATALAQSQGATIIGITQEKEAGKTVYEVETKLNGRTKDISIGADGGLLDVEEEIPETSLPPAVKASLDKAVGRGKLVMLESITRDGKLQAYEAHVEIGGKKSEIKLSPEGQLVK